MSVKNIPNLIRHARETHRKHDAFLVRKAGQWVPVSIDAFARQVEAASAWLRMQGVNAGDRVLILSESRYEWAVVDCAIVSMGAITVPIYATLPASQIAPLVSDSGSVGAFVSNEGQAAKLEQSRSQLRWIWSFDDKGLPQPAAPSADVGATAESPPRPEDIATIIYTSGTTGTPKGVMLTHGNIVSEVVLALKAMPVGVNDLYLSFLPLSHVFERCSGLYTMLYAGVTIAYAESIERVVQNIQETHPTVILGMPRLYEKVVSRAVETASAAGGLTRRIFDWAYRVAVESGRREDESRSIPPWLALQRSIAAALVYRKIARGLGGRTRLRVSGGAPLTRDIGLFYRGAGLGIREGFGLTETSAAISVNRFDKQKVGSAGPLLEQVEIRIAEDGEILVRGPMVMKGYWQKPAETAEALKDGWFHTGDIGRMDEDGFLWITDRKKDLLVTSGGKKIAPQPIEAALKASPRITEALVVGDGRKYVGALIVPAAGATREAIAEDVEQVNRSLAQFEKIKRFELIPDDLTIEKGFVTPSLKVKRKAVLEHHSEVVKRLFQEA